MRPDVFVIVTERFVWQRGQNALFAFGALAGARRVAMIDSRSNVREGALRNSLAHAGAFGERVCRQRGGNRSLTD